MLTAVALELPRVRSYVTDVVFVKLSFALGHRSECFYTPRNLNLINVYTNYHVNYSFMNPSKLLKWIYWKIYISDNWSLITCSYSCWLLSKPLLLLLIKWRTCQWNFEDRLQSLLGKFPTNAQIFIYILMLSLERNILDLRLEKFPTYWHSLIRQMQVGLIFFQLTNTIFDLRCLLRLLSISCNPFSFVAQKMVQIFGFLTISENTCQVKVEFVSNVSLYI